MSQIYLFLYFMKNIDRCTKKLKQNLTIQVENNIYE